MVELHGLFFQPHLSVAVANHAASFTVDVAKTSIVAVASFNITTVDVNNGRLHIGTVSGEVSEAFGRGQDKTVKRNREGMGKKGLERSCSCGRGMEGTAVREDSFEHFVFSCS